jgi:pimeloyl-ACP methyl ester carboxylesterase
MDFGKARATDMEWMRIAALLLALTFSFTGPVRAEVVEEVIQLPSAGDARLPVLLSIDKAQPPRALAVLFNGGGGAVRLLQRIPQPGANFLVRSRGLFAGQGVATAVIDVPTDLNVMSDAYRMSRRHADDVRTLVNELKLRFPNLPVFLVGTSRGTVSAAYAGAAMQQAVSGVVLTSTVFNATRGGAGVSGIDWDTIRSRLLFVHHVDDGCEATPYVMAQRMAAGRTLISVHGGDAPRSDPCEAFSAHGYLGVEAPVVTAIVQWMMGEAAPKDVP